MPPGDRKPPHLVAAAVKWPGRRRWFSPPSASVCHSRSRLTRALTWARRTRAISTDPTESSFTKRTTPRLFATYKRRSASLDMPPAPQMGSSARRPARQSSRSSETPACRSTAVPRWMCCSPPCAPGLAERPSPRRPPRQQPRRRPLQHPLRHRRKAARPRLRTFPIQNYPLDGPRS